MENATEQYLTSFVVKRDMFHAFFGILDDSEMEIEYDNHRSTLPNSQIEETSTNQITSSQTVDLGVTQVSQLIPMHQREESSINIPPSQIAALSTSDMTSSVAPQPLLAMTHVAEQAIDITTQSQGSELPVTLSTSSQMDGLQISPKPDEILTRAEAIARYSEWKVTQDQMK